VFVVKTFAPLLFDIACTDNRGYREMYEKLKSTDVNPLHRVLVQAYSRHLENQGTEEPEFPSSEIVIDARPVSDKSRAKPSLLSRPLSGGSSEDVPDTV
jgi:hypothetical protein